MTELQQIRFFFGNCWLGVFATHDTRFVSSESVDMYIMASGAS